MNTKEEIRELKIRFADYIRERSAKSSGYEEDSIGRAAVEISTFIAWLEEENDG